MLHVPALQRSPESSPRWSSHPDQPRALHSALTLGACAAGDEVYQQIEVDMFRMAALYVLERQKPGLVAHLLLCLLQRSQQRPRPQAAAAKPGGRPLLSRASTLCAPPTMQRTDLHLHM